MKPLFSFLLIPILCCSLIFPAACRQSRRSPASKATSAFAEHFERGGKRAYATGTADLESGAWLLDRALIGNSDADLKTGTASLRIAAGGKAEMLFDLTTVPDTISMRFGPYGNDRDVQLSMWFSGDGGATWSRASRNVLTHPSGFSVLQFRNDAGYRAPLRLRIQNDGTGRINVDDILAGGLSGSAPAARTESRYPGSAPGPAAKDVNLLLGNPGNARPDPADRSNYLLVHPQYTVSYNDERGTANWVSWHLGRAEQGDAPRCNCFSADASLPEGFYRVQSSNYIGSGFDRGHICASDDRSGSAQANAATFLMTNIAPQAPDLNQKCWKELEEYLRRLTDDGKELYVISGVYGEGGTGSKGPANRIGNGRITVPGHFWKLALVLPEGENDLRRITPETEVIAVDMPNNQRAGRYSWQSFRCTVSSIEKATGLRFFSALPPATADALRSR